MFCEYRPRRIGVGSISRKPPRPQFRTIQVCLNDLPATLWQAGWCLRRLVRGGRPRSEMRRREFISLLGGAAASWPLAACAQQPAMSVIGFLHPRSEGAFGHVVEGFRRGLAESDFLKGRNVAV